VQVVTIFRFPAPHSLDIRVYLFTPTRATCAAHLIHW